MKYPAAAAASLQSCPTLCDPMDCSLPGFSVHGILQARTLEWVAISFSNAWKWKVKVKSLSRVRLLGTPWTVAYQAPLSMGFSRQEYWSGVPLLSPWNILYAQNRKYRCFQAHIDKCGRYLSQKGSPNKFQWIHIMQPILSEDNTNKIKINSKNIVSWEICVWKLKLDLYMFLGWNKIRSYYIMLNRHFNACNMHLEYYLKWNVWLSMNVL